MSLNETPLSQRIHIGIFGKRNAGKSSLINAITNQDIAIVSSVLGTTTDPVYKTMEILPLGPTVIIDTPGLDDVGTLGKERVKKAISVLNKTDIAIIVVDISVGLTEVENHLIDLIKSKKIPYIIAFNKCDENENQKTDENSILVSAKEKINIEELKIMISKQLCFEKPDYPIISDLVDENDFVILVVPIDSSAPKGRLILPQQQTIRELLDVGAVPIVTRPSELNKTLENLSVKPKLVVTDSQAFDFVSKVVPDDILLTSFSILMARHKGILFDAVAGAKSLEKLNDGDYVLISEGCTHHRQCEDIGTVKLPKWISDYTGKKLNFEFTSGTEFKQDLSKYNLVVHCGGCMLNFKEMKHRFFIATQSNVNITNYGIIIAYMNKILERTIKPFDLQ